MKRILAIAFLIAPLVASAAGGEVFVPSLETLQDDDKSLSAASALASDQWQRADREVPNFGFQSGAFWFRFTLYSADTAPELRLAEIQYPMLDQVDVYIYHEGALTSSMTMGDRLPFSQRQIAHRNLLIPLRLKEGETTVLLRVETEGVMQMPLTVYHPVALIEIDEIRVGLEGAFFGIMLVMLVYNLFLYVNLREKRYLYYVCHVAISSLFLATLHGLAFHYLWPDWVWWQARAVPTLVALSVVFISVFVTSFLDIQDSTPAGRFFRGLAWVAGAMTIMALFLPYAASLHIAGLLSVVALSASLVVSVRGWLRGQQPARYLVLAWTTFVLGSIALALQKFGVLPRNAFTEQGMLIGAVMDVVLLSIALADRVRQERALREQAQQHALEIEHAARERLGRAVQDRTRELEETMVQLRSANEKLQRLSDLDGLTGVHNRRFFDTVLEREWNRARENDTELSLILIDVDHFKSVNDEYGHLLGDECLKAIAGSISDSLQNTDHTLSRYGGEEFAVLLPDCSGARAAELANRVREDVSKIKVHQNGREVELRISAGVAGSNDRPPTAEQLVNCADEALYRAKKHGRNRVCHNE